MAYLVDQEELLASIQQPRIMDYMREAMSCYSARAYRGCIVLSCIAMFDDLVDKLNELSKVDRDAKEIYNEVVKRQKQQDVYENYLLEQLGAKEIIPELTVKILGSIKDKRNRSAHPSGHHPTAEEARYVFSEVIRMVLSKPKLTTTQAVDSLLQRLSSLNFFPNRNIDDVRVIVEEEVQDLHPRSFPYLIAKLVDSMSDGSPKELRMNVRSFLFGLSDVNSLKLNSAISGKFLKAKVEDTNYSLEIIGCISANPELFQLLDDSTILRFRKILKDRINSVTRQTSVRALIHPSRLLRGLIQVLPSDEFTENFSTHLRLYLDKQPYDTSIYSAFEHDDELFVDFKTKLLERADSRSYDIANSVATNYPSVESDLVNYLSDKDAFMLILNVMNSASNGAYEAKSLRGSRFDRIPLTKTKARNFALNHKAEAEELIGSDLLNSSSFEELFKRYLDE